jgi:hypothetical protein
LCRRSGCVHWGVWRILMDLRTRKLNNSNHTHTQHNLR